MQTKTDIPILLKQHWDRLSTDLEYLESLPNDEERRHFVQDIFIQDAQYAALLESFSNISPITSSEELASMLDFEQVAPESQSLPSLQRYRILRSIGMGGMGEVFEAERKDETKQRVAIKILHRHLFKENFVKRFKNEQFLLSKLLHPNIATLYDTNTLNEELPYFVMEMVDGIPITTYCQQHQISIEGKIKLILELCNALDFAHQRLIIHRDIKPSNVLVNKNGMIKVLDFGISKSLNETLHSEHTNALFSMGYASPEQLRGETSHTTMDVYSVGVLLFEVLTNATLYDVANYNPYKALKLLEDNPLPKLGDKNVSLKQLSGYKDLDAICTKVLALKHEERYQTIAELTRDLNRWLQKEPISIKKPSFTYRTERFIARRKKTFFFGLATVLIVFGSLGYSIRLTYLTQVMNARLFSVITIITNIYFSDNTLPKYRKLSESTEWIYMNLDELHRSGIYDVNVIFYIQLSTIRLAYENGHYAIGDSLVEINQKLLHKVDYPEEYKFRFQNIQAFKFYKKQQYSDLIRFGERPFQEAQVASLPTTIEPRIRLGFMLYEAYEATKQHHKATNMATYLLELYNKNRLKTPLMSSLLQKVGKQELKKGNVEKAKSILKSVINYRLRTNDKKGLQSLQDTLKALN